MSRYSGRQGRGAAKKVRETKRREAYLRQCAYVNAQLGATNAKSALDPALMLPAGER